MDAERSFVYRTDPVKEFAGRLRRLQVDSGGPSVRDLERLTDKLGSPYSRGTIQDKLTGRSTAVWEFVVAFVRACALHAGEGEPDLAPWRAWHAEMTRELAAARAGRRRVSRPVEVCPYRGLEVFTAEHAEWFYGRGVAVQQVLAGLATHRPGVLLLGPSGAGKSSLVQAGVLPALARGELPDSDRWIPVLAGPGTDLLGALQLPERPAVTSSGRRHLLVVDQFEQLLTPPAGGPEQAHQKLIDELTGVIGTAGLSVLLIMRDDFYPRLASQAPELLQALTPGLVNASATLSKQDLHDIITKPAEAVGLVCQDGLPERIVADTMVTDADAVVTRQAPTTVLPLLELTLQQLWQRRTDGCLTHEAYQRIGGVAGGLAAWCDTVMDQLPPARRGIAQRLLTALVRPADDTHGVPAVRQQVPLATLRQLGDIDEVLGVLTAHRIVITRTVRPVGESKDQAGVPVAQLVHDALIRDWGTLRGWVSEDHRFQDWLRRAAERRTRWTVHRDPGDLLHGTELAEGIDWATQRRLSEDMAAFLAASRRYQLAGIRRARRVTAILATLLAVAVVAAGLALWQRENAVTAQRVALSRQLAAQSAALIDLDYDLAALLSVQAYRTSPTSEALSSLYAAAARPLRRRLTGHTQVVTSVVFSPDGRTVATGSLDGTVRLWDAATGLGRTTLTGHTGGVDSAAFSPDGRTLATGTADGTVRLWDAATGLSRTTLTGHTGEVDSVAFSPDGRTLATGSLDGTVRLWDTATGKPRTTLTGHTGGVDSVAFSPDGSTLATGSLDSATRLWDVASGKPLSALAGTVLSVAFSPDGRTLATGGIDSTVRLWDIGSGQPRTTLAGAAGPVAFSPDGRTLATGSLDGTAGLWDTATGLTRTTLTGHTGVVLSVAFSPDGRTLATGSADATVRRWDVNTGQSRGTLTGHSDYVNSVAFSPDGRILATGSGDGTIRLWDAASGKPHSTLISQAGAVTSVAFSPDGRTLAAGTADSTILLWDMPSGKPHSTLISQAGAVASVAFSPDGRTLATGNGDGTVRLWDVASGLTRNTLYGHTRAVYWAAFSPDGRTLATGSGNSPVRLWDVTLPTPGAAIEKVCRAVHRNFTAAERAMYLPLHQAPTADCA